MSTEDRFPCCKHCNHYELGFDHSYPCSAASCVRAKELAADLANFRAELRDRLDRGTDSDHGAAFGWLADNHPDLVREALDETGAPS